MRHCLLLVYIHDTFEAATRSLGSSCSPTCATRPGSKSFYSGHKVPVAPLCSSRGSVLAPSAPGYYQSLSGPRVPLAPLPWPPSYLSLDIPVAGAPRLCRSPSRLATCRCTSWCEKTLRPAQSQTEGEANLKVYQHGTRFSIFSLQRK